MTNFDDQFDLRKRHPLARRYLLVNELQSRLARLTLRNSTDVEYGSSLGEKLDIFPAPHPNAPVLFFIHGGYFRALDKRQYSYLGKPFVGAGCTVVLINYDLAPAVSVGEIVDQNIKAFLWVCENIDRWNGDPGNIVICGHSVGAFLAAKIIEFCQGEKVRESISGAVLLSGLYDLTKMKQSYLNASLNLSDEDVASLSPAFGDVSNFPQAIVAVGKAETAEFIQQSLDYSKKLQDSRESHEFLLLEGKNHYTVSRMLSKKNGFLVQKILVLCGVES